MSAELNGKKLTQSSSYKTLRSQRKKRSSGSETVPKAESVTALKQVGSRMVESLRPKTTRAKDEPKTVKRHRGKTPSFGSTIFKTDKKEQTRS